MVNIKCLIEKYPTASAELADVINNRLELHEVHVRTKRYKTQREERYENEQIAGMRQALNYIKHHEEALLQIEKNKEARRVKLLTAPKTNDWNDLSHTKTPLEKYTEKVIANADREALRISTRMEAIKNTYNIFEKQKTELITESVSGLYDKDHAKRIEKHESKLSKTATALIQQLNKFRHEDTADMKPTTKQNMNIQFDNLQRTKQKQGA